MTLSPEQEAFVRDVTKIGSIPKSEARRRLQELISLALAAREKEIEKAINTVIDRVARSMEECSYLGNTIGVYTDRKIINTLKDILASLRSPKEDKPGCKSYVRGGIVKDCTCGECF